VPKDASELEKQVEAMRLTIFTLEQRLAALERRPSLSPKPSGAVEGTHITSCLL
jgi:hypothetical protein